MRFLIWIFIVGMGGWHIQADAQIWPKHRRDKLLQDVEAILNSQPPLSKEEAEALKVPFAAGNSITALPARNVQREVVNEVPVVEEVSLTEEQVLRIIAREFKPRGSLIFGDQAAVQFAQGRLMRKGSVFGARVRDTRYEVELLDITPTTYTLRLGSQTLTQSFEKK